MKKAMFALLAAVLCSSAMAEVLIYDYSASFKRINDKVIDFSNAETKAAIGTSKKVKLDSASVKSDKFVGFVAVEACKECSAFDPAEGLDKSAQLNDAVVYIYRNGGDKKDIYRAIGTFYADMFGSKSGIGHKADASEYYINADKFSEAAGFLNFAIKADGDDTLKLPGYMGDGHVGIYSDMAKVYNAGFGKVYRRDTKYGISSGDWCLPGSEGARSCWAVKNLSGNVLGGFEYAGYCSAFLFDLCMDATGKLQKAFYAPINGTFSLKLNNGLTFKNKEFLCDDFVDAEISILGKMKFDASKGYVLFANTAETTAFETAHSVTLAPYVEW